MEMSKTTLTSVGRRSLHRRVAATCSRRFGIVLALALVSGWGDAAQKGMGQIPLLPRPVYISPNPQTDRKGTDAPESLLRELHPWAESRPGAWKRCVIMTETRDANGKPLLTSTRENRITLEAFEPLGARLRIESSVTVGSVDEIPSGDGRTPGFFDPHPRVVIEPLIPGLPNIPVTESLETAEDVTENQTTEEMNAETTRPRSRIPFSELLPPPDTSRLLLPPLARILPAAGAQMERTEKKEGGISLRFGEIRREDIDVGGRAIRCNVQTIWCEDEDRQIVSELWSNRQIPPYLFRRTTTIQDRRTSGVLSRQSMEVWSLDRLQPLRRGEEPRRFIQTRMTEQSGGQETTTYLLSLPEVPGQVVRYTMSLRNQAGQIESLTSMMLTDFGNGAAIPVATSKDSHPPPPLPAPPVRNEKKKERDETE